jgi:exosome complex RNA-binding protein Rrp42 (RNase PH superfamily)
VAKRKEVKLTPQMLKDRTDAAKKAREDGKKPKEVREIALNAMKATEEQKKVLLDTEEMLAKTRIEIGKLLSDEQKSKLPKQLQNNLKEPATKKK